MSLSSSSGPDSTKNILAQVLASTPQTVPQQDKLAGNETKQVQQTRSGKNTEMQSDTTISGTAGKDNVKTTTEVESLEQQGLAAGKETQGKESAATTISTSISSNKALMQSALEEANKTLENSMASLESLDAKQLQEVQDIVFAAISGKTEIKNASLETPNLPKPGIAPRKEVMEIGLALAKAIASLGEATRSALSNYASTQAQTDASNKMSLEKQGLKIDKEREEYQKTKELQEQAGNDKTLDTVNTVMMAVSITLAVISVVVALVTCGIGLVGTVAAAGVAAGAGAAAATTTAASVATQVTIQAVVQAVKTAVVQAVKLAIQTAIKALVKQGIKAFIKTLIKSIAKAISKAVTKIFSKGTNIISKAFPRLSKVLGNLTSKWVGIGMGIATAVPAAVKGIGDLNLANVQQELAQIQKEVGKLTAQSEMMKMFTQFWVQASRIAAKQTGQSDEMSQQAVKLAGQITKAFTAISAGLASAV
ncbi:secretion system protein [Candidatus Chlamydia sanziniae]|uniref:Uncharacterized protein n=1 Tax=Candidatus Chlamydia sanziniae TaxID=1806891 RepID=A0A1A9HUE4_9CHLA|nr:secretion system protein [Candidatus Chlamydia sanziniae]ANH78609.1 hypothetical protein Cs308_0438 [Candidatus Chlamydia sanziniae]